MVRFANHLRDAALRPIFRGGIAFAIASGAIVSPSAAQAPTLALLDGLEKGIWEVRYRDDMPPQRICVRSGRELIQLRHTGSSCGRYAIDAGSGEVTVQYSCKPKGFGRTKIRLETRALVQIDGNGVENGLPYQFAAEARRVGSC